MSTVTIAPARIIDSGICVTTEDGQKVYEEVYKAFSAGNYIEISFSNVTRLTTAFLNAAVGQLYGEFSAEEIRKKMLPPVDAEPWQLQRLKLVVDRAKQYFDNQPKFKKIAASELGIADDDDN